MKISAGILPFRFKNKKLEVFLVRLGGPFWKNKKRSWTIVKGEVKKEESLLQAAKREFFEETKKSIKGDFIDLGELKSSSKINHIFAVEYDLDTDIHSNEAEIDFYGKKIKIPEVSEAKWFEIEEAKEYIIKSLEPFLNRLKKVIKY